MLGTRYMVGTPCMLGTPMESSRTRIYDQELFSEALKRRVDSLIDVA